MQPDANLQASQPRLGPRKVLKTLRTFFVFCWLLWWWGIAVLRALILVALGWTPRESVD